MCHSTDGMDKVAAVEVLKPVLVWVMSVQATIEVMSRGVLYTVLVTSILKDNQNTWYIEA